MSGKTENLSMAVIQSYREALCLAAKKAESDAALIESLSRYIDALEGKAAMQEKTIQGLRERLDRHGLPFTTAHKHCK